MKKLLSSLLTLWLTISKKLTLSSLQVASQQRMNQMDQLNLSLTSCSMKNVRAAIDSFIERGGLIIGICNGFQALVKSGLLPYGNFEDASSTSPTLFYIDANQHVAKMVETRIANTNSPWLAGVEVGDIHAIPVSHGEGKFVVTAEEFAELRDNGQIFTQYVDFEGKPSMDSKYNPNGSVNAIEGITSKNGQIIGKMGHSERFEDGLFQNIPGNKDQHLILRQRLNTLLENKRYTK